MSSMSDLEHLFRLVDRGQERVALLRRVVEVERRARRRGHAKPRHEQLVAEMSRPHAETLAVEGRRDVVWVDALDIEGDDADAVVERLRSVDRDPRDLREARQ